MRVSGTKLMTATARTSLGDIALIVDRDPAASWRPAVLMIHGSLRHSDPLECWFPLLAPDLDLVLIDLPGHGRSPGAGPATIADIATRVRELIGNHFRDRPLVVVGESVGGLVALALADGLRTEVEGVVAADPPLTTGKQWAVYWNFLHLVRNAEEGDYRRTFFRDVFGCNADETVTDRIYYGLVANARVPALIMTGDTSFWPGWPLVARTSVPSLIDDVDRHVIGLIANPHVSLETIAGAGHLYLDKPGDRVRDLIMRFCAQRLLREPPRAATLPLPEPIG